MVKKTDNRDPTRRIEELEQNYLTVVEHSLAGLCIFQSGRIIFANSRLAQILGFEKPNAIVGLPFWELVHPEDREFARRRGESRERGEPQPSQYELRALKRDGSSLRLEVRANRIQYQGRPAVVADLIDITERKQAEDALRESEERYRLLAENTSDLIFIQDMDLNLTYVSPSVTALSGYTVEEALQLKREEFLTPESLKRSTRTFQRYAALAGKGEDIQVPLIEAEYVRKDGSTFWGELKVKFLKDSEGNLIGIQGSLRDITQRKEAEAALRQKEKELAEQAEQLEEVNTALKVLLDQREAERRTIEGNMASNVQRFVYPYLEKLQDTKPKYYRTNLRILETNLQELFSSTSSLTSQYLNFTPAEIQVADLVKQGKTNKEIAAFLHISPDGVSYHRKNIRKKLGLANRSVSLRSHLLSNR